MLFIIIGIIFSFIFFIALFGDYKSKEIERDYKKYKKITKGRKEYDK